LKEEKNFLKNNVSSSFRFKKSPPFFLLGVLGVKGLSFTSSFTSSNYALSGDDDIQQQQQQQPLVIII